MYLPDADYADEAQKHADIMFKTNKSLRTSAGSASSASSNTLLLLIFAHKCKPLFRSFQIPRLKYHGVSVRSGAFEGHGAGGALAHDAEAIATRREVARNVEPTPFPRPDHLVGPHVAHLRARLRIDEVEAPLRQVAVHQQQLPFDYHPIAGREVGIYRPAPLVFRAINREAGLDRPYLLEERIGQPLLELRTEGIVHRRLVLRPRVGLDAVEVPRPRDARREIPDRCPHRIPRDDQFLDLAEEGRHGMHHRLPRQRVRPILDHTVNHLIHRQGAIQMDNGYGLPLMPRQIGML